MKIVVNASTPAEGGGRGIPICRLLRRYKILFEMKGEKMLKKLQVSLVLVLILTVFSYGDEILIKKWFRNKHTFVIVCKGSPNESLDGKARIESAKEAALINAQFISRAIFDNSVDIFRNGTVEKFRVYKDYAVVYYVIEKRNLKRRLR